MPTRRFLVALVSAPAAAAVTFYFLWLTWIVFFASRKPGEALADWNAAISLWRTWPIIAVAFVCALVMELVVGLPLLAWISTDRVDANTDDQVSAFSPAGGFRAPL